MLPIKIGKLKSGYVAYWYEFIDGKKVRHRFRLTATTKQDAWPEGQRVHDSWLALKETKLTFEDVWKRYEEYLEGRRTSLQLKGAWKTIGPFFKKYHPLQINDELVEKYLKKRREDFLKDHDRKIGEGTLYNEVNLIQSTLNFAKKKKLIKENPHQLKKPVKPAPVDRWLTAEEIQKLLVASEQTPHLHVAIALMLATAGRIGAVLDLTWGRIDLDKRTIDLRVEDSAHRKGRAFVPMNQGMYDLLLHWKLMCDSDFVVEYRGDRVDSIRNAFRKAVKRAKLDGKVTPHVLRHTAAVHMVANGCSMQRVSQYLGHSSIATTEKIYARYAPEHLREESEAVDFLKDQPKLLGAPQISEVGDGDF